MLCTKVHGKTECYFFIDFPNISCHFYILLHSLPIAGKPCQKLTDSQILLIVDDPYHLAGNEIFGPY